MSMYKQRKKIFCIVGSDTISDISKLYPYFVPISRIDCNLHHPQLKKGDSPLQPIIVNMPLKNVLCLHYLIFLRRYWNSACHNICVELNERFAYRYISICYCT